MRRPPPSSRLLGCLAFVACLALAWATGIQSTRAQSSVHGSGKPVNVFEGLYGDGGAGPAALPMFAASHGLRFSTAGLSAGMGLSIAPLPNLAIETDAGIDTARAEEPGGRRRHRVASLLRPQMQFAQGQRGARGVGLGVGVERTGHARVRRSEQPLRAQRSWWFRNEISVLYAHQSGG